MKYVLLKENLDDKEVKVLGEYDDLEQAKKDLEDDVEDTTNEFDNSYKDFDSDYQGCEYGGKNEDSNEGGNYRIYIEYAENWQDNYDSSWHIVEKFWYEY